MLAVALAILLWTTPAWAGARERDAEATRLQERGLSPLNATERTQLETRGWRDRRTGEIRPLVGSTFRPSDYVNATKRGTVEYDPDWSNYSYHVVKVPDGTVIDCGDRGCNFSQIAPLTDAFDRSTGFGHNLTFHGRMNLVNVKIYPDWTVECNCNTAQIDQVGTLRNDTENPDITNSVYVAPHPDDVDTARVKPVGVLE